MTDRQIKTQMPVTVHFGTIFGEEALVVYIDDDCYDDCEIAPKDIDRVVSLIQEHGHMWCDFYEDEDA